MTDDDVREIVYQALRAIRATPEPTSGVRVGVLSYNETVAFDAIARALADQRGACVDSPKPTVADSKLRQKANTSMSEGATQAPPRDSGREPLMSDANCMCQFCQAEQHTWSQDLRALEDENARLVRIVEDGDGQLDELQVTRGQLIALRRNNHALAERVRALEGAARTVSEHLDVDLRDERLVHVLDEETRTKILAPALARAIDALMDALAPASAPTAAPGENA